MLPLHASIIKTPKAPGKQLPFLRDLRYRLDSAGGTRNVAPRSVAPRAKTCPIIQLHVHKRTATMSRRSSAFATPGNRYQTFSLG